jgi:hypothetical protein
MVDFKIPNLCGASPELNDVLSKLADAKADAKAKLDEAASTAAAAFGEAQNELAGLKDKLQSIEIPTLPKLNLQAEIAGLASQIPGTPSFLSALAKIKTEFGDDIKSAGLELDSLVSSATSAISGGGDICALVPNLEKDAGSTEPAVQKPIAPKQAAVPAVTEASSVVKQNPDVETKVVEIKTKTESYVVTKTPPTEDTGSYVVATETKKISVKQTVVTVTTDNTQSNVASPKSTGFVRKFDTKTERLKIDQLEISEESIIIKNLKHHPSRIRRVLIHPTDADISALGILVEPESDLIQLGTEVEASLVGATISQWRREKKPPYYKSKHGPHMIEIVDGGLDSAGFSPIIGLDGSVRIVSSDAIPKSNHPGNVKAVATYRLPGSKGGVIKEYTSPRSGRGFFRDSGQRIRTGSYENKMFKGYALMISYDYQSNYDPDVKT